MAVQRFEDSLQRQHDSQLRPHVHALQDECRDHVGQEEDKACVEINCSKPCDIKSVRRSKQMRYLHVRLASFAK